MEKKEIPMSLMCHLKIVEVNNGFIVSSGNEKYIAHDAKEIALLFVDDIQSVIEQTKGFSKHFDLDLGAGMEESNTNVK